MAALRVLVYVQHLLGIGHLKRAATLARALAAQGMQVTLTSGGPAVPGKTPAGGSYRILEIVFFTVSCLVFMILLTAVYCLFSF